MLILEIVNVAEVHVQAPAQISPETLQALAQLIAEGSEVNMGMVARNLQNAVTIAWSERDGQPVGVMVLKRPVPAYRDKVFDASGVGEQASQYNVEIGYVYVVPEERTTGTSMRLGRAMLAAMPPKVFATTRENNSTINKLLTFLRFQRLGNPYASARGDYQLLLWANS
jgi:hypothetical protein